MRTKKDTLTSNVNTTVHSSLIVMRGIQNLSSVLHKINVIKIKTQ